MNVSLSNRLDLLLDRMEAIAGEQPMLFDQICKDKAKIILYGAGKTGRDLAAQMVADYGKRILFSDMQKELWGRRINGIPVLSPSEAAAQYGKDSVFVITVFNREFSSDYAEITNFLGKMGATCCIPWAIPAWKYKQVLLPRFFLGSAEDILPHKKEIQRVFDALHEERSQVIFLELMEASLTAPFGKLSKRESGPQYFIPELLAQLTERVCIVDCGAYDGDTLRDALSVLGAERIAEYFAIEPDPENFKRLQSFCDSLPLDVRSRVSCYQVAAGAKNGTVSFASTGTEGAFVTTGGDNNIPCLTVDSILREYKGDSVFFKMDIEGYEKDVLQGSMHTLSNKNIKVGLAIAVYHKYDDFYKIPLLIAELTGKYGIFRKHMANLFETVYYNF